MAVGSPGPRRARAGGRVDRSNGSGCQLHLSPLPKLAAKHGAYKEIVEGRPVAIQPEQRPDLSPVSNLVDQDVEEDLRGGAFELECPNWKLALLLPVVLAEVIQETSQGLARLPAQREESLEAVCINVRNVSGRLVTDPVDVPELGPEDMADDFTNGAESTIAIGPDGQAQKACMRLQVGPPLGSQPVSV